MQNETQKEITSIQSTTSRQTTQYQVYAQNELLAYQQKKSPARVAAILATTHRYMHKIRWLLINRRSLLLALRLLWKARILPRSSRFPGLCAKGLRKLRRVVRILRMSTSGFFFFQAEDGIRDLTVTGVQTCALPI